MRGDMRWAILAVLFAVRLTMAFQFESVAAISPVIMDEFGVNLADIGILISLYLAPGVVIALPGGEIGRRCTDKSVVASGLVLMISSGLVMALASAWPWQLAGRLIGGTGGVLLNVLMSKIVTDWFADREIATAMGIFVNSWPIGIALGLVVLPPLASISGATGAFVATSLFAALGLVLLVVVYRTPRDQTTSGPCAAWPVGATFRAVLVAGCIWGLYNTALGMVFGFGTVMLAERGWSLTAAGSIIGLLLWLVALSVPVGGMLADRGSRHAAVMLWGFALSAATLGIAARTEHVVLSFVALGLVGGISAGPIMSLPARVLGPAIRANGMGIFYTVFYVILVAGPIAVGKIASVAGTSRVAFDAGVVMLLGCVVAYCVFSRMAGVQKTSVEPRRRRRIARLLNGWRGTDLIRIRAPRPELYSDVDQGVSVATKNERRI
jgi:MFS family permease